MKVVVCGPPHSGKSVFISGLVGQLSRRDYYIFRACPDGEGTWTYKTEETQTLRRKGQFCDEFVGWAIRSLHQNNLAPCVIVDVGGRMSEQNRQIMAECNFAIILSSNSEATSQWLVFCKECGLQVIADLNSDYHATNDVVEAENPMVCGSVHHLERGEDVTARPAIEAVGRLLNRMIEEQQQEKKMTSQQVESITITIDSIAQSLGKTKIKKVLPNGRQIETIEWAGDDLVEISRNLHATSGGYAGKCVDIDGGAPGFLVGCLVHEMHPADCRVNSPDGFIPIRCRQPEGQGSGENLEFSLKEQDGYMLVTCQQKDPSKPLDSKDLENVSPPDVPMGTLVVLNGRMPHWLLCSLAMSYHGRARAVAANQPGVGATVFMTHSSTVELGSLIPVKL